MAFTFALIEPHRLENQSDGRRLALEVFRALRDAGRKRCSAHPQDRKPRQKCGALLAALNRLCEDGTSQARAGFSVVLADLLGATLAGTEIPEEYEHRERMSLFMRWRGTTILKEDGPSRRTMSHDATEQPKKPARDIDWGALNPGRKFRETGPRPFGTEAPESAEPGKARSPAPHPRK